MKLTDCTREELLWACKRLLAIHGPRNSQAALGMVVKEISQARANKSKLWEAEDFIREAARKRQREAELTTPFIGRSSFEVPGDVLKESFDLSTSARAMEDQAMSLMEVERLLEAVEG